MADVPRPRCPRSGRVAYWDADEKIASLVLTCFNCGPQYGRRAPNEEEHRETTRPDGRTRWRRASRAGMRL